MRDINKVILMGRLGVDPILRTTQNGTSVANFSLATENPLSKDKDKQESDTTWHRIVVWGKPAEWCQQQLQKGMPLLIEGRIRSNKYEDDQGKTRYTTEIHTDQVHFIHARRKNSESDISAVEAEESLAN
ncbi:MAG: single-stranded DNA-binding protein [Bdellovibrionales bacterium]|nr:single-stranded DNA-binding protein [Bdellovibrionales bacterium]